MDDLWRRGDGARLSRVQKLAWQAMTAVKDTECQEKMATVERYAAALYSDAQHHNWRMTSLAGGDFLRLQILRALAAFSTRLASLEAGRQYGGAERPTDLTLPRRLT